MKKYNIKVNGLNYTDHYLILSLDDYKEYMVELNNRFAVSESEIKNLETFVGHGHSVLTSTAGILTGLPEKKEERLPVLFNLKLLHAKVLSDQLNHITKGDKLVINKNGGYFPIKPTDNFEFVELKLQSYTEKDIKINKWYGGMHYYAKIDNIDVVDDKGNVKWNTPEFAKKMAIQYMNELNAT